MIVPALLVGPPLLGMTYLALVALPRLCEPTAGQYARLEAVGRMGLSAYLLQSLICVGLVTGFGPYGAIPATPALGVVAAVWALLLLLLVVVCPWWLRRFRMGPVEWVWRSLTYGRRQPFRRALGERASTT